MLHLIEGCRSDICQQQPLNRDELLDYTYCVACCVGLTSARIMGAGEAAYPYAIALGHALQMVNIIRDVAEDCGKSNRIYLPREDMDRFGYTLERTVENKPYRESSITQEEIDRINANYKKGQQDAGK